jgi:CTP:molybdopterin cytidylyltransferase MocA
MVLAGGVNRIPLYDGYVPGYKALLPIAGKPAIQYTLEALWSTPAVESICVIGPRAELEPVVCEVPAHGPVRFEEGGDSLLGSVLHGLHCCREMPRVLVATADLPLLTAAAISDFLDAAAAVRTSWEHNLYLAVVPKRCYTGPYAHFTKPFNPFRDIAVCHGNLALIDPNVVENNVAMHHLDELYRSRKSPVFSMISLGAFVGLAYALGVQLLHALTLEEFSDLISRHFHMGILPVPIMHPEVSIDVDDADDYRFVTERFRETRY